MTAPIRVLHVGDEPESAALTAASLERESDRLALETAPSAERGLAVHAGGAFDCLVAEYDMPDTDGLAFFERLRANDPAVPFILYTDAGSADVARRAIEMGVTDYVRKGDPAASVVLANRIELAVRGVERAAPESAALEQYQRLLAKHDLVLDRMSDVFTALDTDWTITYLNEGGRRAIVSNLEEDRSKEDLIGEHFWSINDSSTADGIAETALYKSCHEAMERQEMVTHEKYYEEGDYWVYTRVYPSESGVSIFSRDITDRKRKERELERRIEQLTEYERRIERLEEFAGVVSHDLRNPLNVAQGHLELARETADLDHLDKVARSHERMAALVEDLLTLAREGSAIEEFDQVGLAALVAECWATVDTGDATLESEVERCVLAERTRLGQLFENLFRNAVEHAGPAVTVRVIPIDGGFAVEDDGPGIPSEDRDRVFEAGYSTAREGTGFGLQIVTDVADAHGWDLAVADGRDGGARFEFTGVEAV